MPAATDAGESTILIVDDTPINLQVLMRILEGSGYRILVARNGRNALDIARRARPDLVLLDVAMPDMDGFEVCRALKQDQELRDTVVIFLSALDEATDKVMGLELGAADYVTKPFQAEEVLARVSGQLLSQRLGREVRRSRDQLEKELRSAGDMQRQLLPRSLPTSRALAFAAHYRTSLHAGGDYYDVLEREPGRCSIFVADVSGHGARAAVIMAMIRTLVHSSGELVDHPAELLLHLNRHFRYLEASAFATVLCAHVELRTARIRLACAGHPHPLLVRDGQPVEPLTCESTMPLFIRDLASIPESEHQLRDADRLVFYTDGITEQWSATGEMFGVERLMDTLAACDSREPTDLRDRVVTDMDAFTNGRESADDQTLLVAAMRASEI